MSLVAPLSHRDVFGEAVLLFSSGSTGEPKGVMLSHHNINSDVYSFMRVIGWTSKDKITASLPLFHAYGLNTGFWVPFMAGIKAVYVPNPLDAAAIGKAIETHKLTVLLATPTFLQSYMRKIPRGQFASIRIVITGAEKLRQDVAAKFKELTGLPVTEGYGCTELSPVVTINVANSILDLGVHVGKPGSIGPPMPGICIKIADPVTLKQLPPDTDGLMLVKGANVMTGYLGEPEKTAEVIVNGWYNTGDIAKMDSDGHVTITGRLSRFSKIGGEMVPHEAVESAVNELFGHDVRPAVVCGAPDGAKGERLIVLHTDAMTASPEEIITALRGRGLPNLWIPKAANFFKVPEIPVLASGKLNLVKVREMAAALSAES
jgi:acyl-[acyl-carrier-protein]-phospholipid O-acyltransferase/long-chain-fatty-acid--[acyl-carrier-protein] ligase